MGGRDGAATASRAARAAATSAARCARRSFTPSRRATHGASTAAGRLPASWPRGASAAERAGRSKAWTRSSARSWRPNAGKRDGWPLRRPGTHGERAREALHGLQDGPPADRLSSQRGEPAISRTASIREAVTFACCPPGPDERLARSSISASGTASPGEIDLEVVGHGPKVDDHPSGSGKPDPRLHQPLKAPPDQVHQSQGRDLFRLPRMVKPP